MVPTFPVNKNDIRIDDRKPTTTKGVKELRNLLNLRFERSETRSAIKPSVTKISPFFRAKLGTGEMLKNGNVAVAEKTIARAKNNLTPLLSS